MKDINVDIVIFGGGIAGLWSYHALREKGYDVILLENQSLGGGQSISSQGILHSGLKYAFAGHINKLAKSISEMPDIWKQALEGYGNVDLTGVQSGVSSQYMLIPKGMMRGIINLVTNRVLGEHVQTLDPPDWPRSIIESGFKGTVIYMDEPVLDTLSVMKSLAQPYKDNILKISWPDEIDFVQNEQGGIDKIILADRLRIVPKQVVFTAAGSNEVIAKNLGHDKQLETQKRPLQMIMAKKAPFALYVHLVGTSEKPLITITTHRHSDGDLIWYMGGSVAEREKNTAPEKTFAKAREIIRKYLPDADLSHCLWQAHGIDRVEGKKSNHKKLPDTPVIHTHENALYAWPTKWTFAPLLFDELMKHLAEKSVTPSDRNAELPDLAFPGFAKPPWEVKSW